jgi:hypothetical protein
MRYKKAYVITDEKKYTDLEVVAIINKYYMLLDMREKLDNKIPGSVSLEEKKRIREKAEELSDFIPKNIGNHFAERPFQIRDKILRRLEDL